MIHVPSRHVARMLAPSARPGRYTEDDEADFCKRRFRASLVGRGGHVFAHTSPNAVPAADRLESDITPKVTFCSAYACTKQMEGDAPVELYGWKNFAEVFLDNNWKKGSQ